MPATASLPLPPVIVEAAANGPDPRHLVAELDRARRLIEQLRNPAGAVALGVQMLAGPLRAAIDALPQMERARIGAVLSALQTSTGQLSDLLGKLAPRNRPARPYATPDVVPQPSHAVAPVTEVAPVMPTPVVQLDPILRRLEVLAVTRSTLPLLLAIDTQPGPEVAIEGSELLRALAGLVENAAEASSRARPGAGPWTVMLRSRVDGDAVCIEIRNEGDPMPAQVSAWLDGPPDAEHDTRHGRGLRAARAVVESASGRLSARRERGETVVEVRLPVVA